jgi:Pectate lyase superfamily protein
MTAQLAPSPVFRSWDNLGFPLVGGQLFTYAAGTSTPQATYTDSTQTTQNTNPVILNFRGEAFVWLDLTLAYKFILKDINGNLIWTEDNISSPFAASGNLAPTVTNTFTLGTPSFTWANAYFGPNAAPVFDPVSGNIGYYARTAAEIAAGVTPVNYAYAPYDCKRYGARGDGTTDDTAALTTWLSLANNNLTSLYLSPGTYKVTSTLVIPGNNITIYGAGVWASQINCAITGNPANPLFSWTANAGGTTGQFLQVQGIRFNGNGLTGASGNGHCFALLGDLGVTFANFPTFRDCDFVSFAGNGKNSAGTGIAAAGIYIYDGDVLKVENCIFEACNQGICIDGTAASSTQKVCVSACTFDNLTTYGIQALFVTNLLVNNQTIFNNMGTGVYLSFAQETTTIDNCRFKIFSGAAVNCVTPNLIDQVNITNNYFYTTFQASPPGVLDLGNTIQGLNISGNEFLFDSTVVAGLGILFQDFGGGQVGNSYNVTANRFVAASLSTISSFVRANNPTGPMNSLVILGNYFGQQNTPSFAYTITAAIALTGAAGGIGTLIANNTFYVSPPGVMTAAITLGSGWNSTFLLNNAYQGPGTNVSNSGINTLTLQGGTFTVPTISTGWGTATGTGVITNFTGSAATLAQTGQVVATLINLLKQQGILGA